MLWIILPLGFHRLVVRITDAQSVDRCSTHLGTDVYIIYILISYVSMDRKFIYYKWPIDCMESNWWEHEVIWSIIWKDSEWFLVERFNWIWDCSNDIKHTRMDSSIKPPRMKKEWKYVWIRETNEQRIKYIWKQTR